MPVNPVDILEGVSKALKNLRGKSRIEKLADLADILRRLAEVSEATDDPEIEAAVDAAADTVRERIEKIRKKIK